MRLGIALRSAGGALAAVVLLSTLSGCSGAADQSVVTVTLNSAPAHTAPATTPGPGSSIPSSTAVPATPSRAATSRSTSRTPPTPSSSDPGSEVATTVSGRTATATATATGTTSTTGPVQASADPDVAGPDDGPACPVDKQYSDEPPTGLRADVKAAWISVKKRAAGKGVTLCLNDGKRSKAQQIGLFNLYVKEYGSVAAHELVLPWQKSAHVKGYAVDVQPAAAYQWLQATKGTLGFCRIYDNEAWHFEYSLTYQKSGCPARQPEPVG